MLICYSAHLSIDVHCSTHLKKKKKNLFKPLIKIIQVLFFFHSFILDLTVLSLIISSSLIKLSSLRSLSSALISQALISKPRRRRRRRHPSPRTSLSFVKLSSLKLSSPSHAVAVAIPAHPHLSHLSSSHFSHLSSSHLPAHTVAILAVVVAIPRRPSPCLNPIHFRSVLSLLL